MPRPSRDAPARSDRRRCAGRWLAAGLAALAMLAASAPATARSVRDPGFVGLPPGSTITGTVYRGADGKLHVQHPEAAAPEPAVVAGPERRGRHRRREPAPAATANPAGPATAAVPQAAPRERLEPGDVDPRQIIPAFNPGLDAVAAPRGFGSGRIWHVGPGRTYKKPSEVARLVGDGDTVEIDAATYKCDAGVKWHANFLTLVGIKGRPVLDAKGCDIPGGKGIWNPTGTNLIVDNIEFRGAAVGDANGAGIRYDGGGYVYLTRCYFDGNQDGILFTSGSPTDIVIDHSEFAHNGNDQGSSHNIYVANTKVKTFVLRFSYSHQAYQGHLVKTRAARNYILYNRLADEGDGASSYNIDVPQGGLTYIIGNIIQQSAASPNYAMLSYSAEGSPNPEQSLYIVGNTIVNDNPEHGVMLNLYDKGLSEAKIIDNLIVGISGKAVVAVTPGKATMAGNLITNAPGFYDRKNRNYALTAGSPAVGKAVDPGSAQGFALQPAYEFTYPVSGKARPQIGGLDIGALEYDPSEKMTPAPTVTVTAAATTIDFNTPARIAWSTTNADSCEADGDWSGAQPTSGAFTSTALISNKRFALTCVGPGGTASAALTVTVNDSAQAAALGPYAWREIPHSAFDRVCAANLKDGRGKPVYWDNFGTGPFCEAKGMWSTGVYVPELHRWYLIGGGGGRNYYGNELYAFDVAALKPAMVVPPTHIAETREYAPKDEYGSKLHFAGCNTILHLTGGGIAIGRRGVIGGAAYDPRLRQIIIGPGGLTGGLKDCSVHGHYGQIATDMWAFDPFSRRWTLLAKDDDRFGSVGGPTWFLDPASGIGYAASNRNESGRGGYLIDYNVRPPRAALVDNVWPFQVASGSIAVDTVHHYALQLGVSRHAVAVFDLNGLSMSRYGTNGKPGTTSTAGGPGPLFKPDTRWVVRGDTSLLALRDVGLTYNPRLQKFVAWANDDRVFFLTPNYRTHTLDILTKHVAGNPRSTAGVAYHFTYLPDRNVYLAFAGMEKNIYFLVPPKSPTAMRAAIPRGSSR